MSLDIYYGFLLTKEDVINLFPNILDENLSEYLSEHGYRLEVNISNKLIIENITDTSDEDEIKVIVGVKLESAYGRYSSALIIPKVNLETKVIMEQFISDNEVFVNMKPQIFAFMHV